MSDIAMMLVGGLLGGTILFVATAAAVRLPSIKRRPALASAMWLVVLVRFALPIPIGGGMSIEARVASVFGDSVWVFPAPATSGGVGAQIASAPSFSLTSFLLLLWAAISFLLLVSTVRSAVRTRRRLGSLPRAPLPIERRAERLANKLGLSKTPQIVLGSPAPLSYGLLRPIVALPTWLDDDDLDAVLAHELAHIARRDPLWALLVRGAEIALFFWPLVWIASRKFKASREEACDSAAVAALGTAGSEYARSLIAVSAELLSVRSSALAMAARPSQLGSRVSGLLANARAGVGVAGALVLAMQVLVALPGSAKDAEAATPWGECVVVPGMGASIMNQFPDADRDGDGMLSRAEICAHQQRMREVVDDDDAREIISEAIAPMCVEELRCSEGDDVELYGSP